MDFTLSVGIDMPLYMRTMLVYTHPLPAAAGNTIGNTYCGKAAKNLAQEMDSSMIHIDQ